MQNVHPGMGGSGREDISKGNRSYLMPYSDNAIVLTLVDVVHWRSSAI